MTMSASSLDHETNARTKKLMLADRLNKPLNGPAIEFCRLTKGDIVPISFDI